MSKRNNSYDMTITIPSPSSILEFIKVYDKNDTIETKQVNSIIFSFLAASGTWMSIILATIRDRPPTFGLLYLLTLMAVPTLAVNIYKPRTVVATILGMMLPHILMYKSKW